MSEITRLMAAFSECVRQHPELTNVVGAAQDFILQDEEMQSLDVRAEDVFVKYFTIWKDDLYVQETLKNMYGTNQGYESIGELWKHTAANIISRYEEYFGTPSNERYYN